MKFFEMLERRWDAGARVCLGLDSAWEKIPSFLRSSSDRYVDIMDFNTKIIHQTAGTLLCYKPNLAFYSGGTRARQLSALRALHGTLAEIRMQSPNTPIIIDGKRTDIGSSNEGYVAEVFGAFGADAITVNPYFGGEALMPFLRYTDKGIIVLCRTSNPGAGEFQDRIIKVTDEEAEKWQLPRGTTMPLYQLVAYRFSREWNLKGNIALVVGATYPEELKQVRKIVGDDMWLLNPGVGKKQGGKVEDVVLNGVNSRKRGIIVNGGSDVIFASSGEDFAEAAKQEVQRLTSEINRTLNLIAD